MAVAGTVSVFAGQIQIGQTISGVNVGLTTTYMTLPDTVTNSTGCTTGSAPADGCANGSTTGYSLKNYDKNVFAAGTPAQTPFTGYSNTTGTASTAGSVMTDPTSGVTFAMLSQSGNYGNVWGASGNNTVTIPIGVFGVQNAWTMLNNYFGKTGDNDTDVTFTFDNNQNGSDANSLTTVTVDLVNGTEVRSAFDCTSGCGSWVDYATGLASGATNVSGSGLQCVAAAGGAACPALVSVTAENIWSSAAGAVTGGAGTNYAGATGTVMLDDQEFQFGSQFANEYLVSIGVQQLNFSSAVGASGGSLASDVALSAVTVTTASAATPEPSTMLLLLGGFGILGFARVRRRA